MGPEDSEKKAVKVCMIVDGQPVEISPEIVEITYSEDQQGGDDLHLEGCEFTMRVKFPKSMRCKNRKRFVKLLMASGISRNVAQVLARGCVVWRNQSGIPACLKTSYQGYFNDLWMRGLVKSGERT